MVRYDSLHKHSKPRLPIEYSTCKYACGNDRYVGMYTVTSQERKEKNSPQKNPLFLLQQRWKTG